MFYSENIFTSFQIPFNTLSPYQNGHHFAVDIFNCIIMNESILIPISVKFISNSQ